MKTNYTLVEVTEHDIYASSFKTKEEAHHAMLEALREVLEHIPPLQEGDLESALLLKEVQEDFWGFNDEEAWCSYFEDYDWKIFEQHFESEEQTFSEWSIEDVLAQEKGLSNEEAEGLLQVTLEAFDANKDMKANIASQLEHYLKERQLNAMEAFKIMEARFDYLDEASFDAKAGDDEQVNTPGVNQVFRQLYETIVEPIIAYCHLHEDTYFNYFGVGDTIFGEALTIHFVNYGSDGRDALLKVIPINRKDFSSFKFYEQEEEEISIGTPGCPIYNANRINKEGFYE